MILATMVLLAQLYPFRPPSPISGSGSLSCSKDQSTATVNLTTTGTSDWAKWDATSTSPSQRKSGGGSQISAITVSGSGAGVNSFSPFGRAFTWTNGTPTGSGTAVDGGTYIANWTASTIGGLSFTVPASTSSHVANSYLVLSNSTAVTFTAHLADSSATDYTDTESNGGGAFWNYYCTYTAGTTTTLNISWLALNNGGGTSNVTIQAVTYQ